MKRISIKRRRRKDISEFPAKADASMKSSQDQNDEKSSENFLYKNLEEVFDKLQSISFAF